MKHYEGDKSVFIDEVQKASRMWDAAATSSSIEAVRSGEKRDMDEAKAYVARAHASKELADKVINLVHGCFKEIT